MSWARHGCCGVPHKNSPNIKRSSPLQQIEKIATVVRMGWLRDNVRSNITMAATWDPTITTSPNVITISVNPPATAPNPVCFWVAISANALIIPIAVGTTKSMRGIQARSSPKRNLFALAASALLSIVVAKECTT
jgi:hypothetical protein